MTRNLLLAGLTALAFSSTLSACGQQQTSQPAQQETPQPQKAETQPTRFTVAVTGQGPDVILVPGLSSSADVWKATEAQLVPTHRVHVVQVKGFAGAAPGPNASAGALDGVIAEIADYASKLDHPAIIGHSLGGLVSLEAAAKKPDAFSRVLVVDALPFYALIMNPAATSDMVKPQAEMMRMSMLAQPDAMYKAGASMTAASLAKTPEAQAQVTKWVADTDKATAAQMMYDDIITDARPRLPAIKARVTVTYAYDPVMGPETRVDDLYKSAYMGLPGVTFVRTDNSYHFIMLDQPTAFAKTVADFLK